MIPTFQLGQFGRAGGRGASPIAGSAALVFTPTGALSGGGDLAGTAAIAFTPTATISGDPYFSSITTLLHFDGSNGSTTATDSASSPKTYTANGNAQLSTSRQKYGTAAGEFDGTGDYFSTGANTGFHMSNGNFTMEGWFETDTVSGVHALIGYADGSASNSNYEYQLILNGSSLNFSIFSGTTQYNAIKSGVSTGVKYHWALVRNGNDLTAYLDGVGGTAVNVTGVTTNNRAGGAAFHIGQVQGFYPWDGMMDDIRITKGVARYTANFTPPAAAFPNS